MIQNLTEAYQQFKLTKGKIEVSPSSSGEQTLAEVFADGGDENQSEWKNVLMYEAQSLINMQK